MTNAASPIRYSPAQIGLGIFILWQIIFLAGANIFALIPHGSPDEGELTDSRYNPGPDKTAGLAQTAIDLVGGTFDRWGFVTGQVQAWWLFAPDVPKQATFPAVELIWDTPPHRVALRSPFEPQDPHTYFKMPGSGDRLFHYESRLGLLMVCWDKDLVTEHAAEWRDIVENRVRRQWRSIRAYFSWRVRKFLEENPDSPKPDEAILRIRIYRSPLPDQPLKWEGPMDEPLAR